MGEKIKVVVRGYDHHWGWKKVNNIPVHTVIGLWGFEADGIHYTFRIPISRDKFDKHCRMIESNFFNYWIYECDRNYILRRINKNARLL